MNFRHMVLVLSCPIICYCAPFPCQDVTESKSKPDNVDIASLKPKNHFKNLYDHLYLYIDEFLVCPRLQLGSLDRNFREIFTTLHKYSKTLAQRHGIVELENSTSDSDLLIFCQLAFIKLKDINDRKHLYRSIHSLLFEKNAFFENKNLILRYLIRTKNELWPGRPLIVSSPESYDQDENIEILKESPDYDYMIEYVVKNDYSFRRFCVGLDMNIGKDFMTRVMNINEDLYRKIEKDLKLQTELQPFNQEQARINVYNHLLRFIRSSSNYYESFFFMSILANVPDVYFFPVVLSYQNQEKRRVAHLILYETDFVGTEDDNIQIYDTMNRLLNQMPKCAYVRISRLCNSLRYGSIDSESLILQLKALDNLDCLLFYKIVAVASLAKNSEALKQIRNHSVEKWDKYIESSTSMEHGINIFLALFEIYSETELQEFFDRLICLKFLMKCYDLGHFEYDEITKRSIFNLILKPEFSDSDFPKNFDISLNINSENIQKKSRILTALIDSFFNQHNERDVDSVRRFLLSYKDFVSRGYNLFNRITPASNSILKTISGSDILVQISKQNDFHFIVDGKNAADLLEIDISNLRGIINLTPLDTLLHIRSFDQIRNLERYLESNIVSIMKEYVISNELIDLRGEDAYFKLNTVLRYCLRNPNRKYMVALKSKLLVALRKEVDNEDSKFLEALERKKKTKSKINRR